MTSDVLLCDKRVLVVLKEKYNKTIVWLAMIYDVMLDNYEIAHKQMSEMCISK